MLISKNVSFDSNQNFRIRRLRYLFLGKQYRDTCSGHGRFLVGRCKCDRLYYGVHCQYREECLEDSDCGDHGKCVDVEATTAPRQQCYCQLGWFGPGCIKRNLFFIYLVIILIIAA